jgi:hypothetical protein
MQILALSMAADCAQFARAPAVAHAFGSVGTPLYHGRGQGRPAVCRIIVKKTLVLRGVFRHPLAMSRRLLRTIDITVTITETWTLVWPTPAPGGPAGGQRRRTGSRWARTVVADRPTRLPAAGEASASDGAGAQNSSDQEE